MKTIENLEIRNFSYEEIPAMMELSAEAGWNQPEEDIRDIIRRSGKYLLGAFDRKELIGVSAVQVYPGAKFAFVNEVIVKSRYRRCGVASKILSELLPMAAKAAPVLRLCATDLGKGVYGKLGFVSYGSMSFGEVVFDDNFAGNKEIFPLDGEVFPDALAFDRGIYGADRSEILKGFFLKYPDDAWYMTKNGNFAGFIVCAGNKRFVQAADTEAVSSLIKYADITGKALPVLLDDKLLSLMPCRMEKIFSLSAMQFGSGLAFPQMIYGSHLPDIG